MSIVITFERLEMVEGADHRDGRPCAATALFRWRYLSSTTDSQRNLAGKLPMSL